MNSKRTHLLEYPRTLLQCNIIMSGCERRGEFNHDDYHCAYCPDSKSCHWINNVKASQTGVFTREEFTEHLEYALDRMIAYVSVLEHNIFTCSCDTCGWIQEAMQTRENLARHQ